jgi:hypothetical protein
MSGLARAPGRRAAEDRDEDMSELTWNQGDFSSIGHVITAVNRDIERIQSGLDSLNGYDYGDDEFGDAIRQVVAGTTSAVDGTLASMGAGIRDNVTDLDDTDALFSQVEQVNAEGADRLVAD